MALCKEAIALFVAMFALLATSAQALPLCIGVGGNTMMGRLCRTFRQSRNEAPRMRADGGARIATMGSYGDEFAGAYGQDVAGVYGGEGAPVLEDDMAGVDDIEEAEQAREPMARSEPAPGSPGDESDDGTVLQTTEPQAKAQQPAAPVEESNGVAGLGVMTSAALGVVALALFV